MRRLGRETSEQRLFGLTGRGHEGRIQRLEKAPAVKGAGVPSVATFFLSTDPTYGDTALTVAPGNTTIVWPRAFLPSDGSITGPIGFGGGPNEFIQFNTDCVTIEWLYTGWDPGAYARAAVLGTASRIIQADRVGLDNGGNDDLTTISQDAQAWALDHRPNAHVNGDLMTAYLVNGDTVDHTISHAVLIIYAWPAPGYLGAIPGYPL